MDEDVIARRVVHAAMQIHSALGPGLLETAYRACLQRELSESGLRVDRELVMPVRYKGVVLDVAYRIDLLVERAKSCWNSRALTCYYRCTARSY
jgi:GxxExxY protein